MSEASEGPCPSAILRDQLYSELRALDGAAVSALSRAFDSPDVLLRRNVASALDTLGGGYDTYKGYGEVHGVDISAAIPGLLKGLSDSDPLVRGWSAQAFLHVGPKGSAAVPKLIDMLRSSDEGDRNSACIGLRGIGSGAKAALPALKSALLDRSEDVRRFASLAIESIE